MFIVGVEFISFRVLQSESLEVVNSWSENTCLFHRIVQLHTTNEHYAFRTNDILNPYDRCVCLPLDELELCNNNDSVFH